MKKALVFGATGQIASHQCEQLLAKEYQVIGVARRVSVPNTGRLVNCLGKKNFSLRAGDVTDPLCLYRLIEDVSPDEIFNWAAQSFVGTSFDYPSLTWAVTAGGCLNILEVLRTLKSSARFYQASSSEMYGSAYSERMTVIHDGGPNKKSIIRQEKFQNESTPFLPRSPYAIAKLAAHQAVRLYREAYGLHASCGINFNSESSRRGCEFVTQKIATYVRGLHRLELPAQKLRLGNVEAFRDWGAAQDTSEAAWLILQQDKPDDYVVATGETHPVREFLERAFSCRGITDWRPYVEIDPSLFRPAEVPYLRGDASKARRELGWRPTISFDELVRKMVFGED